ncbi:hypothetical protein BD410DRAFT_786706 [Rickenella mellea]|uniref:Uncharacterized protein n=1 Tax=Rickenella mellea TaxID=50990 RepID=A0A4Y7Q9V3_9AGAM|nr:hypothetical protein BD410DRAFT_786706 [Rickenella mellea]
MVVTRKAPSTPLPPTSRTPSSQGTHRTNKGKAPQSSSLATSGDGNEPHDADDPHSAPQFADDAVFSDGSPSPKKSTSKNKKKGGAKKHHVIHRNQKLGWTDTLARLFLLCFTIYSLSVCPSDNELKNPVCRGLSEYRRLVIEPYLIPPVQRALAHPAVAPIVTRAKPIYAATVRTTKPIYKRTKREWRKRVVPQWNKRVVPFVRPYIQRVESAVAPYTARVQAEYAIRVVPRVAQLQKAARRVQPHVVLAVAHAYDAYDASKPYVRRSLVQLGRIPPLFVRYVLNPLGDARRVYVDAHVARMLEKAKELSSGAPREKQPIPPFVKEDTPTTPEIQLPPIPKPTDSAAKSASSIIAASEHLENLTEPSSSELHTPETSVEIQLPPIPEPTDSAAASAASIIAVSEHLDDLTSPTITPENTSAYLASSVVAQSVVELSSSAVPEPEPVQSVVASSSTEVESSPTPSPTPEPTIDIPAESEAPSSLTVESESTPPSTPSSTPESSIDIDVDSFFAELESDDSEPSIAPKPTETPSEFTEEDLAKFRAERREKTIEDRKNIMARHDAWEAKLEEAVPKQRKALRKALVALRKTSLADLKAGHPVLTDVEKLHTEAEKSLKGTEAYLSKLKGEVKPLEERRVMWEQVLGKVEERFAKKTQSVEKAVNEWYGKLLEKEEKAIEDAAAPLKDLGLDGQADIGYDYAWLDDVTPVDWKRYHDLVRVHKDFLEHARTVQQGTHPSPPVNPVLPYLQELESDVNDVVVGFETRMRRIRREGARLFGGEVEGDDGEEEEDIDGEEDESEPESEAKDPEVSILPIPKPDTQAAHLPLEGIIIGRGEDEVLSALAKAEEPVAAETHAGRLMSEVVDAKETKAVSAGEESSTAGVVHEEL